MNKKAKRVVLIGLDGAFPEFIKRFKADCPLREGEFFVTTGEILIRELRLTNNTGVKKSE